MCGRFTLRHPRGHPWLGDIPDDGTTGLERPRYNVAPSQTILAIGRDREGVRRVRGAVWGFRPRWLPTSRRAPINARAETAAVTPMFRNAFRHGRCLVPADGWYEWQTRESGPQKPHFFHRHDDAVFFFAGLAATDADGGRTVALLTTEANESARDVHPRMPLLLADGRAASAWIDPVSERERLDDLLRPPPADVVVHYPVSRLVNRPENDGPRCTAPEAG